MVHISPRVALSWMSTNTRLRDLIMHERVTASRFFVWSALLKESDPANLGIDSSTIKLDCHLISAVGPTDHHRWNILDPLTRELYIGELSAMLRLCHYRTFIGRRFFTVAKILYSRYLLASFLATSRYFTCTYMHGHMNLLVCMLEDGVLDPCLHVERGHRCVWFAQRHDTNVVASYHF